MLTILQLWAFFVSLASLSMMIFGTWKVWRHFKSVRHIYRKTLPYKNYPPITILKPHKGIDFEVEENIRAIFELKYPNAIEIIFCLESIQDPVYGIIKSLISQFPIHIEVKIQINPKSIGNNPKINNIANAYETAKYDTVLISDSNVRLEQFELCQLVDELLPDVGIVTSIVVGTHPNTFGALLESMLLNTFYARFMILGKHFNKPCVVGKSMLFKKSVANRFGGIVSLSQFLAEDYMAGIAMTKLGLRVAYSAKPVYQIIGNYKIKDYWSRHVRWGKIRKNHAPLAFLSEPQLYAISISLGLAFSMNAIFSFPWLPIAFISFFLIFLLDVFQISILDNSKENDLLKNPLLLLLTWMIKELLMFPLWLRILIGNHIFWRGKKLKLKLGGMLEGANS